MADDFFADFGETLHQAAKEFSAKTDSFFESQKIRNRIAGEQKKIDICLKDIGNIIYKKYVDGEPMHEDVAALCEQITGHKVSVAKLKESMAKKKGEKVCAACGASMPKEAQFCMKCGEACKDEPEEEVVEDPKPVSEEEVTEDPEPTESVAEEEAAEDSETVSEEEEDPEEA